MVYTLDSKSCERKLVRVQVPPRPPNSSSLFTMSHLSKEILKSQLEAAYRVVPRESVWVHYKDPLSRYIVKELVIIEATDKVGVAYPPEDDPDIVFIRPLVEWLAEVEVDGMTVPRFMRLDEQERS